MAVFEIFNSKTYGLERVAAFLHKHVAIGKLLSWSVIFVECSFHIALVVGHNLLWLYIAWGLTFHLLNAGIMGLNTFFWAFVATHPAVIYSSLRIQGSIL